VAAREASRLAYSKHISEDFTMTRALRDAALALLGWSVWALTIWLLA
jgi:hypothetical protein